jgi:hypothetical protein
MLNPVGGKPAVQQSEAPPKPFEDPWGIAWRARNFVNRIDPARTARFWKGLATGKRFTRPVFVIGAPRSGTTMLHRLLQASSELASMPYEGHDLWRIFHHPRYRGWSSDHLAFGDAVPGERRFADTFINSRSERDAARFVEKTPENSLRIGYLRELYPDAIFVVLRRDPCDVISSLIKGWRHPRDIYRSYYVPTDLQIPHYPHRRQWCFALIEGWRDYVAQPIPEIAFEQWWQCTAALKAARNTVAQERWYELYFEDLLEQPEQQLKALCEAIDIGNEPALQKRLTELLATPVNAMSPPGRSKWQTQTPEEISQLLPRIASLAADAGYSIDSQTGAFSSIQ